MPKGGLRPGAPQNNMGVSATGGNGSKNGQPMRLAPGGKYGDRTAMATQQSGAPMANDSTSVGDSLPAPIALTEPSQLPDQHVLDGTPEGPGSNVLNLPAKRNNSNFNAKIESYAPVLQFIASQESTSSETRSIITMLLRGDVTQ